MKKPRQVEQTVNRLLDGDHPHAGRIYASFLARLVDLLDAKYGKAPPRQYKRLRKARAKRDAIELAITAHPEWSYRHIAETLGLGVATVSRYAEWVREKHNLPQPKPGRKAHGEQTWENTDDRATSATTA